MKEKYKIIEAACKAKIPKIQKQTINMKKRMTQHDIRRAQIVKQDNVTYIKLWDMHQKNFKRCINKVEYAQYDFDVGYLFLKCCFILQIHQIDQYVNEYLGISRAPLPCVESTQPKTIITSILENIILNLVFPQNLQEVTATPYQRSRNAALDKLILEYIVNKSTFINDDDLKEVLEANPMQNLPYVYNALCVWGIDTKESLDILKSEFKPFVKCVVCNSQVNWEMDVKVCKNVITDNW